MWEVLSSSSSSGVSCSSGGLSLSFCYKGGQNDESVFCDMNRLLYFVVGFF